MSNESKPQPSITCPQCKRTSYHPEDIRQRYCGACHAFHDELPPMAPNRGIAAYPMFEPITKIMKAIKRWK